MCGRENFVNFWRYIKIRAQSLWNNILIKCCDYDQDDTPVNPNDSLKNYYYINGQKVIVVPQDIWDDFHNGGYREDTRNGSYNPRITAKTVSQMDDTHNSGPSHLSLNNRESSDHSINNSINLPIRNKLSTDHAPNESIKLTVSNEQPTNYATHPSISSLPSMQELPTDCTNESISRTGTTSTQSTELLTSESVKSVKHIIELDSTITSPSLAPITSPSSDISMNTEISSNLYATESSSTPYPSTISIACSEETLTFYYSRDYCKPPLERVNLDSRNRKKMYDVAYHREQYNSSISSKSTESDDVERAQGCKLKNSTPMKNEQESRDNRLKSGKLMKDGQESYSAREAGNKSRTSTQRSRKYVFDSNLMSPMSEMDEESSHRSFSANDFSPSSDKYNAHYDKNGYNNTEQKKDFNRNHGEYSRNRQHISNNDNQGNISPLSSIESTPSSRDLGQDHLRPLITTSTEDIWPCSDTYSDYSSTNGSSCNSSIDHIPGSFRRPASSISFYRLGTPTDNRYKEQCTERENVAKIGGGRNIRTNCQKSYFRDTKI